MTQDYLLFGTQLRILVDEQKSNGNYDLIEGVFAPGVETPIHLHSKYSEEIYVLEGQFTVYKPGEVVQLRAGESIFIPINMPHVVAAGGDGLNKALTIASPSGFAELIRTVGTLYDGKDTNFDYSEAMARFIQQSEVLGDVILGPPGERP